MVWSGVIISYQDTFASSNARVQPWRLSKDYHLCLEFAECLSKKRISVKGQDPKKLEIKYVNGRVLPIRFPNIKMVSETDSDGKV
jgi:hypothetical protein